MYWTTPEGLLTIAVATPFVLAGLWLRNRILGKYWHFGGFDFPTLRGLSVIFWMSVVLLVVLLVVGLFVGYDTVGLFILGIIVWLYFAKNF